jgi:ubiquitin-protein ligase
MNPGVIRLNKDKESLKNDLPENTKIVFLEDETEFRISIKVNKESFWSGATYTFFGKVTANYAIEPPKLRLE